MEEINLILNVLIIAFLIKKYNRLHVSLTRTTRLNKPLTINFMWKTYIYEGGYSATGFFHIPIYFYRHYAKKAEKNYCKLKSNSI